MEVNVLSKIYYKVDERERTSGTGDCQGIFLSERMYFDRRTKTLFLKAIWLYRAKLREINVRARPVANDGKIRAKKIQNNGLRSSLRS
jgi:hypothetical protein